jgi:ubiquinone/menaquinone biosynthesis C-methylase UbiE
MPHRDEGRKVREGELHNALRGHLKDDPKYAANKKWYSITHSNRQFVKRWLLERCRGKRVLDYCCGNGEMVIWLAERGAHAFGIDISPVSIQNGEEEAHRRGVGDRVRFILGDAERMEFPKDYFDYIVVNGVLHHLDLERAYSELSRVLKPEGQVLCTEALRHNPIFHLYRQRTPHLRSAWEIDHILGKHEILRSGGYFESVEVVKFFHLATLAAVPLRKLPLFSPILTTLEVADSVLLRLPVIRWWAWMVVFVLSRPKRTLSR